MSNRYLALRAGCKVPSGTTENSPRSQPWVTDVKRPEPRRGERKYETPQPGSAVPDGSLPVFAPKPTGESVGYFLSAYRAGAHSKSCSTDTFEDCPVTVQGNKVWMSGPLADELAEAARQAGMTFQEAFNYFGLRGSFGFRHSSFVIIQRLSRRRPSGY